MDLITLIIIFGVIARIFKKNSPEKYEEVIRKAKDIGNEVTGELRGNMDARRATFEPQKKKKQQKTQSVSHKYQENRTEKARYEQMNLEHYQKAQAAKKNIELEENDAARMQVHRSRMEANSTTILERAMANAKEDEEDVTLQSLQQSHGHSAFVSPAIHHHPEDEIPENMLEKIDDLMIKGYEGDLCFERDFVGEAMDMVNRFSMGGSV